MIKGNSLKSDDRSDPYKKVKVRDFTELIEMQPQEILPKPYENTDNGELNLFDDEEYENLLFSPEYLSP